MSSLDLITSRAASGMRASQAGIAVVSDNIANAGVAGYTAKRLDVSTFLTGGQSNGVRTGLVARSVDAAVQASIWSSASGVRALEVRSEVLVAINATQGGPEGGASLADGVAKLQEGFVQLQAQPSGSVQQAAVVAAADALARTVNRTAEAVVRERNGVQEGIVATVGALNEALETVQDTTRELLHATAAGQDTAELEDRRDAALLTLSGLLDVRFDKQANGDVTILGRNGFSIPLGSRFSTEAAPRLPTSLYAPPSTAVSPVYLKPENADPDPAVTGDNVTNSLIGGKLGELIQLRDKTLPDYTRSLDAFALKLTEKFSSAQGLTLFTDGDGTLPTATDPAGLSSRIRVNPAVAAAPSLVRDGAPADLGAGRAGFTGVIDKVLGESFAGGTQSLASLAQGFVSAQSVATGRAESDLAASKAYYDTVSARFADGSGVDVDREMGLMIQLQNSYQANARVFQATQTLFQSLLDATRGY